MFTIARSTAQELLRNKILLFILLFSFSFLLLGIFLASISLGQNDKMLIDFGSSMIELFGLVTILFFGSQMLFREIEGKTIYLLLTKPLSRQEFFLGKFFGFAAVLSLIVFVQSLVYVSILFVYHVAITSQLLFALFFILLSLLTILSTLFFFATFSSPVLVLLLTIAVFISGHALADIIDMLIFKGSVDLARVFQFIYILFPPLEALNVKALISSAISASPSFLVFNGIYAFLYSCVMLFFGVKIFAVKSFEN